jgi:hypothetical protein
MVWLGLALSLCAIPFVTQADDGAQAGESHETSPSPETPRQPQFGGSLFTTDEQIAYVEARRLKPNIPTDENSTALLKRLESRWAALLKRDFSTAYDYESPKVRAELDREEFIARFGAMVEWHGIKPLRIDYEDEVTADVTVMLDHSIHGFTGVDPFRTEGAVKERWVEEGGEWWHQSQSVNIAGMAPDEPGQKP